jgi:predicted P-loop ATPase
MISYWISVKDTKKDFERTSVDELLNRIKNGYWKDQVELVRSEQDEARKKQQKAVLPSVTIGGVFNERKEQGLEKHSGFICIDVDNYTDRSKINDDPYTYALFSSVGGNGFAVICKVDPLKHKESYNFIAEHYFLNYGITVDPAPKNVASCRFVSYDPDLFLNTKSKKSKYKIEKKRLPKNISIIVPKTDIGELVNQVTKSVADEYHDYLALSFSIAVGFDNDGREYFHKLCSFSDKYDPAQTDKQYDIALKRTGTGITVGTFYYFLKKGGADLTKYNSDKAISSVKLAKRMNTPKVEVVKELAREKNIDENEALEIVNEIFERNDMDIRHEGGAENMIINCSNFILKRFNIRKNLISRKYEWNGIPMYDKEFNTVFLECRMTFDDKSITFDIVNRIIQSVAIPEYNPFFEYIEANKHRISTGNIQKLCDSVKSNTPLKDRFIRKWMIGIVACIYGNPVRSVLALTGGQNTGKTEWFRRLLPSALQPYYAESNLDRGKDDELLMCEKLIVMDDEMGGKSKQDEKKFKELTSKNYFSLRAAYGRYNEDYKRLAILCGTSNDHQLINDSTGNTRILPIEVVSIDHALYNSIDKDDLFMELHRAYTSGEVYNLVETELSILNEVGRSFESIPFERELILKFFEIPYNRGEWLTATEIKDIIETHSKQRILSMKKLGSELKQTFGNPMFKDRSNKYYVERKSEIMDPFNTFSL